MLADAEERLRVDPFRQMVAQLRYYLLIRPEDYTITELTEMWADLRWARTQEAKEDKAKFGGRPT